MASEDTEVRTVLVVDDDESITKLLHIILSRQGYRVHIAHDGREAVEMAENLTPDLILMDMVMPGMDGFCATEQIKHNPKLKGIPVIFLAGRQTEEDHSKAFAKGATAFLVKPFTGDQIRNLVALTMQSLQP